MWGKSAILRLYLLALLGAAFFSSPVAAAGNAQTIVFDRLDPFETEAQQTTDIQAAITRGEPVTAAHSAIARGDFRLLVKATARSNSSVTITAAPAGVVCVITNHPDLKPYRPVVLPQNLDDADYTARDQGVAQYLASYNQSIVTSKQYPDYDLCKLAEPKKAETASSSERAPTCWGELVANGDLAMTRDVTHDGRAAEVSDVIHAARFGRIDALRALLTSHASVDARDIWNMTALSWAAVRGDAPAVATLLAAKANPNLSAGPLGRSPLMFAVLSGREEIVTMLLDKGATVDALPPTNFLVTNASPGSPLALAAALGRTSLVQLLLTRGASPNFFDSFAQGTALEAAVLAGDAQSVTALLDAGAKIEVSLGSDGEGYEGSAFALAACQGNIPLLSLLATRGAQINWMDNNGDLSALYLAAAFNQKGSVDWLLGHGADVDVGSNLRGFWPGSNVRAMSPLGAAVSAGDIGIARTLLTHGANIHERQGFFGEPILLAGRGPKSSEMFRLLLASGADANARNYFGETALHSLRGSDAATILSELVQHHADINAQNEAGDTPLHTATGGDVSIVNALLRAGADPNIRNHAGQTPIFGAIARGGDQVHALLDAGARLDIRDIYGHTPRDYAARFHREALLQRDTGAKQ